MEAKHCPYCTGKIECAIIQENVDYLKLLWDMSNDAMFYIRSNVVKIAKRLNLDAVSLLDILEGKGKMTQRAAVVECEDEYDVFSHRALIAFVERSRISLSCILKDAKSANQIYLVDLLEELSDYAIVTGGEVMIDFVLEHIHKAESAGIPRVFQSVSIKTLCKAVATGRALERVLEFYKSWCKRYGGADCDIRDYLFSAATKCIKGKHVALIAPLQRWIIKYDFLFHFDAEDIIILCDAIGETGNEMFILHVMEFVKETVDNVENIFDGLISKKIALSKNNAAVLNYAMGCFLDVVPLDKMDGMVGLIYETLGL